MDCPLTPGVAIAIAAVLDAHPRRLPHWSDWSRDLRAWAAEILDVEAAGEDPADTIPAHVASESTHTQPAANDTVDPVAAFRQSVEAAKARREAEATR